MLRISTIEALTNDLSQLAPRTLLLEMILSTVTSLLEPVAASLL